MDKDPGGPPGQECRDPAHSEFEDFCFFPGDKKLSFDGANEHCNDEQAQLASIHSAEENALVSGTSKHVTASKINQVSFWQVFFVQISSIFLVLIKKSLFK